MTPPPTDEDIPRLIGDLVDKTDTDGGEWHVEKRYQSIDDYWQQIIKVHNCAKLVILTAEGEDPENPAYLQPMQEQRNALEHIIRARGVEAGVVTPELAMPGFPEGLTADQVRHAANIYCVKNYEKALGHEYRAFFDAADLFCILISEKVTSLMDDFTPDVVSTVFPDYYSVYWPKILGVKRAVSKIREHKDVGKGDTEPDIINYIGRLDELLEIEEKVVQNVPTVADAHRGWRFRTYAWPLLIGAVCVLFGAWVASWWHQRPTAPTPETRPPAMAPLPMPENGADLDPGT